MRPRFEFMDLLLLTAPAQDPWALRSKLAIEKAIQEELQIRAPFPEDRLQRMVDPDWIRTSKNTEGFLFIAPTPEGAAKHFATKYRVGHFIERDRPFAGGTIEAVSHWFDDHFSPKSRMNARLEESGIPRACLGAGTKWREVSWLLDAWNRPGRYCYISALLVSLLDAEQWPDGEQRAQAWSELEHIFRSAGLRLHERGYLTPALEEQDPEPSMGVWEDEGRFQKEVVDPLLRRIPGVINVIPTHGRDEYGRDFIFDYRHPLLGDRRWVAVQVKAGNISGEAGGQLRAILDQVQMAFEHSAIDLGAMGKVAISEVIVLISGQFTHNAKERILDGIKDPVWRANTFFLDRTSVEGIMRSTRSRTTT